MLNANCMYKQTWANCRKSDRASSVVFVQLFHLVELLWGAHCVASTSHRTQFGVRSTTDYEIYYVVNDI